MNVECLLISHTYSFQWSLSSTSFSMLHFFSYIAYLRESYKLYNKVARIRQRRSKLRTNAMSRDKTLDKCSSCDGLVRGSYCRIWHLIYRRLLFVWDKVIHHSVLVWHGPKQRNGLNNEDCDILGFECHRSLRSAWTSLVVWWLWM